jgi:threonine aldolase
VIDAASLTASIRKRSRDVPWPTLVCAENTHNGAGGKITPLAALRAIRDVATAHGLPVHLDGARLWNASAASGTSLAAFAACADTVMLSFSKGLGCPIGAALVGSKSAIEEAWSVRKRFGGSLRQSGILTAAALYALDHHLSRLPEDHAHAAAFAKRVDGAAGARVVPPDTNIVMLDLAPGMEVGPVIAAAAEQGVRLGEWTPTRVRAVFHLDVDVSATAKAGDVVVSALERSARH